MPEPPQPGAGAGPGASFSRRLALALAAFWRTLRGLPLPGPAPLTLPADRPSVEPQADASPNATVGPNAAAPHRVAPHRAASHRAASHRAALPAASGLQPDAPTPTDGAVVLLRLLQREGRLLDFLLEDLAGAQDAPLAAAARLLHEGCRRALLDHLDIAPVVPDPEGAETVVPAGFSPAEIQLHGETRAGLPLPGRVIHPGWRVGRCELPGLRTGDRVVAPAQIEIAG